MLSFLRGPILGEETGWNGEHMRNYSTLNYDELLRGKKPSVLCERSQNRPRSRWGFRGKESSAGARRRGGATRGERQRVLQRQRRCGPEVGEGQQRPGGPLECMVGWGEGRGAREGGQGPVTTLQVGLYLECVGGTPLIRAQVFVFTHSSVLDPPGRCLRGPPQEELEQPGCPGLQMVSRWTAWHPIARACSPSSLPTAWEMPRK